MPARHLEKSVMFVDRITVGHACDIVADGRSRLLAAGLARRLAPALWQAGGLIDEDTIKIMHHVPRLESHAADLVVAIHALVQEGPQRSNGLFEGLGEADTGCSGPPHIHDRRDGVIGYSLSRSGDQIGDQAIDDPPDGLVDQAFGPHAGPSSQHIGGDRTDEGQCGELFEGEESGAQSIIEIVAAIGDIIGDPGDLSLEGCEEVEMEASACG